MKTERELLQLAAKACGGEIIGWTDNGTPHNPFPGKHQLFWHPMRSIVDMVWVAEKLGMVIDYRDCSVSCHWVAPDGEQLYFVNCWGGNLGTTGDAVLRIAAEIGEEIP